jgi:hypothetical protein
MGLLLFFNIPHFSHKRHTEIWDGRFGGCDFWISKSENSIKTIGDLPFPHRHCKVETASRIGSPDALLLQLGNLAQNFTQKQKFISTSSNLHFTYLYLST